MTSKEAAILTAYTGIMLCKEFDNFHKYAEKLLGRPVGTHEMADPKIWEKLKKKSEKDFMALIEAETKE